MTEINIKKQTLSVIGLGKLGSPMVAAFASRGFMVIGMDQNSNYVRLINESRAPVTEPQLAHLLKKHGKNIAATSDIADAVRQSNITFIIVPTPSEKSGNFSVKHARAAASKIGKALREKKEFHLVVLTSTVLPGSSEKDIISAIERNAKKKCGKDFGFCYNPEFIALGSVIRNLLNPDFVLIGESDKKSGAILESLYKYFCLNSAPVRRMNIINAELTKISINTYITNKISFANILAQICEKLPEGNVDVVTAAMGMDTRIGGAYLKGGLGYGGPCFPRDNRAMSYVARKFNLRHALAEATDAVNKNHARFLLNKIIALSKTNTSIAILGLSYKTDTDVIEESQGVVLAKALSQKGFSVTAYDPVAKTKMRNALNNITLADSIEECIKNKDIVCVTTPWKEFYNLKPNLFQKKGKKTILLDCWRILKPERYKKVARYIPLGVNHSQTAQ